MVNNIDEDRVYIIAITFVNFSMRLQPAISFVESTYSMLAFLAVIGIIASCFTLKGIALVITIIALLCVIAALFFLKLKMINFYLERCKYPYEFLAVLDQLKLLEDIKINWSPDGARNSNHLTKQFLDDNNLVTEIGKRKLNFPAMALSLIACLGCMIYLGYQDHFQGKSTVIAILTIFLGVNIYLLARGRKWSNDEEPLLIFNEKEISYEGNKIGWDRVDAWKVKDVGGDSQRYIIIKYNDASNVSQELTLPLHQLNVERIDCLLLLTHFKSKYGTVDKGETMAAN